MRQHGEAASTGPCAPTTANTTAQPAPAKPRSDWATLRRLLPFLLQYKWRVAFALLFMVGAKVANVSVPILLKHLVDAMSIKPGDTAAVLVVPVGLLIAYGLLRLSTSLLTELRELIFAKATQGAARTIALQTFRHLHSLSLRFHLERQTGGLTRDIERGSRGISSLVSYTLYSILPTLVEIGLVHPPVGMNVYIINRLAKDVPLVETFKGVMPFLASDFLRIILLVAFPSVSLVLVRTFG